MMQTNKKVIVYIWGDYLHNVDNECKNNIKKHIYQSCFNKEDQESQIINNIQIHLIETLNFYDFLEIAGNHKRYRELKDRDFFDLVICFHSALKNYSNKHCIFNIQFPKIQEIKSNTLYTRMKFLKDEAAFNDVFLGDSNTVNTVSLFKSFDAWSRGRGHIADKTPFYVFLASNNIKNYYLKDIV